MHVTNKSETATDNRGDDDLNWSDVLRGTYQARGPAFEFKGRIPIVYSPRFDLELDDVVGAPQAHRPHPFDFKKRSKAFQELQRELQFSAEKTYAPQPITDDDLRRIHSAQYLASIQKERLLQKVFPLPALATLSDRELFERVEVPLRFGTGGTVLAARLAMHHRWSITMSGGFHHCGPERASGMCIFADVPLAIAKIRDEYPALKVMVVDLDAHQMDGIIYATQRDTNTVLFDVYNADIFPRDVEAAKLVKYNFPLSSLTSDDAYLEIVRKELPKALLESKPNLLIYNAGCDPWQHDMLGQMRITERAICERDLLVFSHAFTLGVPIMMTLAGGYSPESARLIAKSISLMVRQLMR